MNYEVLTEEETLDACENHSIARFGDGELRLAVGGACSSQAADPKLRAELVEILRTFKGCMVAIPNFAATPNKTTWDKYAQAPFRALYRQSAYGSAFITRPDNAPWIDTPAYWARVRRLWQGKRVCLVTGDEKSITPAMLEASDIVYRVRGPRQHAYAEIDRIEAEVVHVCTLDTEPADLVILCLGATATVLAARLDARGIHALDLGHMGMFMKHAGAFEFKPEKLATPEYRKQLQAKHASMRWGKDGHSHAPEIRAHLAAIGGRSVLDYGCGRGTLREAMPDVKVSEYDPGIPGKDLLPKPADLVACTDVLEHIEPALLDGVLRHIYLLAAKGAYLVIATRLAREKLPDGRNAHLIVQEAPWWLEKLKQQGWATVRSENRKGLCVWLTKT